MSRLSIDERFAQFEEDAVPTFKPEVDQVYTGVRKLRRKRRTRFVVAAAVILALPAAWFGVDALQKEKPPAPLATPNVRKVNVPGVTIVDNPELTFIDENTGFAVYSPCKVAESPMCRYAVGVTTDAGRTWRGARLPDIPDNRELRVVALTAQSFYLSVSVPRRGAGPWPDPEVWVTDDAGATFKVSSNDALRQAQATAIGGFDLECPGKYDLPGTGKLLQDPSCTTRLFKAGSGPLSSQPPGIDYTSHVYNGVDGRVWLTTGAPDAPDPLRLVMSDDGGKTWQQMPSMPGGSWLLLSPDGKEAYYRAGPTSFPALPKSSIEIARLIGGQWVTQFSFPTVDGDVYPMPVGDGTLLLQPRTSSARGMAFYLKDGTEFPVPAQLSGASVMSVLRDGTVVMGSQSGVYLGAGSGMSREWTFITY